MVHDGICPWCPMRKREDERSDVESYDLEPESFLEWIDPLLEGGCPRCIASEKGDELCYSVVTEVVCNPNIQNHDLYTYEEEVDESEWIDIMNLPEAYAYHAGLFKDDTGLPDIELATSFLFLQDSNFLPFLDFEI